MQQAERAMSGHDLDRVSEAAAAADATEAASTTSSDFSSSSSSSGRGSGGSRSSARVEDTRRAAALGQSAAAAATRNQSNNNKRPVKEFKHQKQPPPASGADVMQNYHSGSGGGGGQKHAAAAASSSSKKMPTTSGDSTRHLLILILFVIGLIVCVSSILCLLLLPSFVSQQIAKKLVLRNNSMLLERWSRPNVPMYFKVWLYDIKNAAEIVARRDTKPRLEEIGPFVFNLKRQKDVISFAGDNLYYTERKIYHFNRELSCCAINTTLTIPNIPLVAVVDRALSYNLPLVGRFVPRLINRAIQSLREQLFVRKQVREILFEGYDVELLRMVSRVGSLVGLPQQSQRFALLKGRNDTWRPEQDGVWAINTGQRERKHFGRVSSWNSYKRLPFWSEPACNVINGSDGTLFPPPIKRTEPLYIFNQELCRTVNLVFERPSDVRSIKSLRFVLNPLNFAHTQSASSSSASASTGAQQSTAAAAAAAARTLLANQTAAAAAARTRINPIFQNRDRLASARAPGPAGDAIDPVSILGFAAPPPPPTLLAAPASPPPRQQQGVSGRATQSRDPQLVLMRTSSQPRGGPLASDSMRPSAPERRQSRRAAPAAATIPPPQPPTGLPPSGPPTANLLPADNNDGQDLNSARAAAKLTAAEEKIRREQEKLIEAAQEAQAATERKTRLNPQTCFCDRKQTNLNGVNVCEFDGLIDLSKCSKQAQVIFGSMPHFYNSDPRLLRQVSGLAPNASRHTTYLDIEPNTGLVLGGKRRVQLNVIIKHNNEIDGFENINDMLVPIVWFEESAQIPEETAAKFRAMYVDRIRMVNYILFSLLVASLALLAVDARLLLATHYWRQFKWHLAASGGTSGGGGSGSKAAAGVNQQVVAAVGKSLGAGKYSKQHAARPSAHTQLAAAQFLQEAAPQVATANNSSLRGSFAHASSGGADSPLLARSRSSFGSAASPTATPDSSPPDTPAGSPELRKWSLAAAAAATTERANTTRVYLNGALRPPDQQVPAAAAAAVVRR